MGEVSVILWVALIGLGYLLGSVLFCQWLPMLLKHTDICAMSDDGNPGAVNVFKLCGWQTGLLCLAMDMAKGYAPVFLALKWLNADAWWLAVVMLAPVAGHAWSCLHRFRGGKCIAVIFGELLALMWVTSVGLILAGLFILFSTVVKIDPHRRRSLFAFWLFLPMSVAAEWALQQAPIGIGCAAMSTVALLKITLDCGMKKRLHSKAGKPMGKSLT